jgi:myo-inositol 2-dehydrogenase / D-chiro-inositol 1-dehydrogenase
LTPRNRAGFDGPVTDARLDVGVIGTGAIGAGHVARLTHDVVGARVVAVTDAAADRAAEVAAGVGARVHPDAEALVADPRVQAVVIASPGDAHAEQAIACLRAGKPVLCEKPLAATAQDAWAVVEAEVAVGRRLLQVGFMRRYDRAFAEAKVVLDSGAIGELLMAHAVHRNASVPDFFVGEMALTDSVVHELDQFRWLFGQEIAAVTVLAARRSPLAGAGLRDPQLVLVELADGALVDVESFVNCRYGYDVRCEVVGSLGTVSVANPAPVATSTAGRLGVPVPADWQTRFAQAYTDELQAWVRAVAAGVPEGPSAWDGYVAAQAAGCAVRSYADGGRVEVLLPERPALYLAGGAG